MVLFVVILVLLADFSVALECFDFSSVSDLTTAFSTVSLFDTFLVLVLLTTFDAFVLICVRETKVVWKWRFYVARAVNAGADTKTDWCLLLIAPRVEFKAVHFHQR